MTAFTVKIAPAAGREIKKLPLDVRSKIIECLEKLESEPRPQRSEKLSHDPRFWRVKAGNHRIIYTIDDDVGVIMVLVVRHRKDAYRNLDALDHKLIAATLSQSASVNLKV